MWSAVSNLIHHTGFLYLDDMDGNFLELNNFCTVLIQSDYVSSRNLYEKSCKSIVLAVRSQHFRVHNFILHTLRVFFLTKSKK